MLKKKIEYLVKNNKFIQYIFVHTLSFFMRIVSFFVVVDPNLYFFTAHNGGINDSPSLIFSYMKTVTNNNNKYIWGVDKKKCENFTIDNNVKLVQIDTIRYFLLSMKSKYWVASVNIERGLRYKKKNQIYLNTWHGIPIKKIGNDAVGRNDYNFSKVNYFIVSSLYETEIYPKALKVDSSRLLPCGLPRNEELYETIPCTTIKKIKEKLNIDSNKKIILYAPTWRESTNSGKTYDISPTIDFNKWKATINENYVLLLRLHPYTQRITNVIFDDFCIDVSSVSSINELIKIADILITDYSSVAFDFSITEKPIIYYAYDYDKYKEERGLYIDIKNEFPMSFFTSESDVLMLVTKGEFSANISESKIMKQKYLTFHGKSLEICSRVLSNSK